MPESSLTVPQLPHRDLEPVCRLLGTLLERTVRCDGRTELEMDAVDRRVQRGTGKGCFVSSAGRAAADRPGITVALIGSLKSAFSD